MNTERVLHSETILPEEANALLVGRVWSNAAGGPCPALVANGRILDLTSLAATMASLLDIEDLIARLREPKTFPDLGSLDDFLSGREGALLAPSTCRQSRPRG